MTELTTASNAQTPTSEGARAPLPPPPTATPSTPVLITAQQVLLGTVAAMPLPGRRVTHRLAEAVRDFVAVFHWAADDDKPVRRDKPARHDYLENSRMAREMWRL